VVTSGTGASATALDGAKTQILVGQSGDDDFTGGALGDCCSVVPATTP